MNLPISKCSSCGAAIVWAFSPAGRRMPIDALPLRFGDLPDRAVPYSIASERPVRLKAFVSDVGLDYDAAYVSHFVTCPNASSHSKRARTTAAR